jgi:hypothetical protein
MGYIEDYELLKSIFDVNWNYISSSKLVFDIHNLPFVSSNNINLSSSVSTSDEASLSYPDHDLAADDCKIKENNNFNYSFFKKRTGKKSDELIILLHGFNEKHWYKYLPWAKALLEKSGKDIILFPLSFHMNRAPLSWSNPRLMKEISETRKKLFRENSNSSFVNASISTRIHYNPLRFLWSGLKTINDINLLVSRIKKGGHKFIDRNARINFFGYSIGAFLSEIVLMLNENNMYNESKLFIFCGGATFNKINPVSRSIIDFMANNIMHKYYAEDFEQNIRENDNLRNFFRKSVKRGIFFKSMLNFNKMREFRERRLNEISHLIYALSLTKDSVFTPENVKDTLNGRNKNIPIRLSEMDYPYDYDHITPFPLNKKKSDLINYWFEKTFDKASESLC